MNRLVLETFYYARDRRNAKLLRAGKTIRIPEDVLPEHVDRFVAEGKINGPAIDANVGLANCLPSGLPWPPPETYTIKNYDSSFDRPEKPKGRRK